jgi:leader peptidase (prepilin peptidase)/N-methyltransferase
MIEYIYLFIFGLFIGSFLNVLADRLSKEITINGRSKCDICHHVLAWYDLMPIISFTLLKGRCRYCRAPIAFGHLYTEILTAVFFVLTWYFSHIFYYITWIHPLHIVITSILIVMLLSDLRYQIIPDEMQIVLAITGVARFFLLAYDVNQPFSQIYSYEFGILILQLIGGAIIVSLPLLAVFLITKGKGMGFGDVKLTFGMGLVLGLWSGLYALYLSFISGGLVGGIILLLKKGGPKT